MVQSYKTKPANTIKGVVLTFYVGAFNRFFKAKNLPEILSGRFISNL